MTRKIDYTPFVSINLYACWQILHKTIRKVGIPILLAGLTTVISFLSLLTNTMPRIREMGMLISFGILVAFQIDPNQFFSSPDDINLSSIVGSSGAILSIFMWSLNPLSDFQCSTDKSRGYISRVVDTTNFVSTWVICGFLVFEIFMYFTSIDLKSFFEIWLPFVPLMAILFGFLPGCGPQVVVATFYLNGFIPLSAELGNAISNDGDALFPAIALAPKAAFIATIYSAIPAIIVAYGYMYLFE